MIKTKEEQIVKVHVAGDGQLWYADGKSTPMLAGDRAGFLSSLTSRTPLHLRLLGRRENAAIITAIYQGFCSPRREGRMELATPLLCERPDERLNPEIAILRMRQCLLPASLGGWHTVTALDYPSYAIAAQLEKDGGFSEHVNRILETHPAWHDLTFLPTLDRAATAELLGTILDPRWYIDLQHPTRLVRLGAYLGLDPRNVQQVTDGITTSTKAVRCRTVLQAWQGSGQPGRVDMERPGNFLWRRWLARGGGRRGNIDASKAFLVYLVRTWQNQLFRSIGSRFFIAEDLLRGAEVAAYTAHADTRKMD